MLIRSFLRGDREARELLEDIGDRATDLNDAWDRLLPQLRAAERRIFATRGYGLWPPNAAATIRMKGRNTPMFDSGKLYRSLTLSRAPGSVARGTKSQLTFGVNDNSIFWAKFVGKRRPFIVSEERAGKLAAKSIDDHLMGR